MTVKFSSKMYRTKNEINADNIFFLDKNVEEYWIR